MEGRNKILVADDDKNIQDLFKELLSDKYDVITADDGEEAKKVIMKRPVDLIILDLRMPKLTGLKLLEQIKEREDKILSEIIVVTADKDINTAIKAMKLGAYDYIVKPFDNEKILILIKNALQRLQMGKELVLLRKEVKHQYAFDKIIGTSKNMQEIYNIVDKIKDNDATILIMGDSGTGKELVAKSIHFNSKRKGFPFVAVDCASIPETLIENELFGHEKGAYTGALSRQIGKFELANKGTLFLDEIGNLRLDVQAKLLRVLQEFEFSRVGGNERIRIDVRVIAATNANLEQLIKETRFREDLFYRLNVVPIKLPGLSERKEDIPLLVKYYMQIYNTEFNKKVDISKETLDYLIDYSWPGNVRELKNTIQRLIVMNETGKLTVLELPKKIHEKELVEKNRIRVGMTLEEVEKILIYETIKENKNNLSKSSRVLGITRKTLHNKLKKYPDLLDR